MKKLFDMKKFVGLLVLFLALGIAVCTDISVNAATSSEYVPLRKGYEQECTEKSSYVKVGNYYYKILYKYKTRYAYYDFTNFSFKIKKTKSPKESGTVIYKKGGVCEKKGYSNGKVRRYDYLDIYTNGKYVVFGEYDVKKEVLTYYRIKTNGKDKKKLVSFSGVHYYPDLSGFSNFMQCGILGFYKDSVYCGVIRTDKNGDRKDTVAYKVSVSTGKKSRVKALDIFAEGGFNCSSDGKYIYNNTYPNKAFNCKTGKMEKRKK